MAATVTSWTASRTSSSSSPPAITITTAAGTSFSRTFRTRCSGFYGRYHSIHAVEVRLVIRIEIRAALDHRCRCTLWHCRCWT